MDSRFKDGFEKEATLNLGKLLDAGAKKVTRHGSAENLNKALRDARSPLTKITQSDWLLSKKNWVPKMNEKHLKNPKEAHDKARELLSRIPRKK